MSGNVPPSNNELNIREGNQLLILLLVLQVLLSVTLAWRVIHLEDLLLGSKSNVSRRFEDLLVVEGISTEGHPSRGPEDAPVTIVEFTDYECPACRESYKTLKGVWLQNKNSVRIVHLDFPLPYHSNALLAANAAMCAEGQKSFWPMHDALFSAHSPITLDLLQTLAVQVRLDPARFNQCLEDDAMTANIEKDIADAEKYGVDGTPTYFINGRKIQGVLSEAEWQDLINAAILETTALLLTPEYRQVAGGMNGQAELWGLLLP